MEQDTTTGGGAANESDGVQTENKPKENDSKTINPDDHQRALKDLHKYKSQAKDATERVDQLTAELESFKTSQMAEKENFKGLYEETKSKLDEAVSREKSLKSAVLYGERHRAVFPVLKKEGLRDDAETFFNERFDLTDIDIEGTTEGRFLVNGVNDWVNNFKTNNPFLFQPKDGPKVNSSGGTSTPPTPQELTPTKLLEIEEKCKKSGNMKPYHEALRKYQSMRA